MFPPRELTECKLLEHRAKCASKEVINFFCSCKLFMQTFWKLLWFLKPWTFYFQMLLKSIIWHSQLRNTYLETMLGTNLKTIHRLYRKGTKKHKYTYSNKKVGNPWQTFLKHLFGKVTSAVVNYLKFTLHKPH